MLPGLAAAWLGLAGGRRGLCFVVLPTEGVLFCSVFRFGGARVWPLRSLVHVARNRFVFPAPDPSYGPQSYRRPRFLLPFQCSQNRRVGQAPVLDPMEPSPLSREGLLDRASQRSDNCLGPRHGTPACRTAPCRPPCKTLEVASCERRMASRACRLLSFVTAR